MKNVYSIWGVVAIGFFAFFFALDALYPNIMEARNFVSAREMVEDGNWIYTTLNEEPRYEKPPLPTWITAVFGKYFGTANLWALRLPPAFFLLFIAVFLYKTIILLTEDKKWAFYTSAIFSTSYLVLYWGRANTWDVYTHSFMFICIYYLMHYFTYKQFYTIIIAATAMGCSILSKGPIAVYALFVPFLIALLVKKPINISLKAKDVIVFLTIALGIGLSWYLYINITDPDNLNRIADKETTSWFNRNTRPFYYYIITSPFFAMTGIWSLATLLSLWWKRTPPTSL